MSDLELRDLERQAQQGEPGALVAFVTALRRAGEDERAWWVMVADADAQAAASEKVLGSLASCEPYDAEEHHRGLERVARGLDREQELRRLDGRTHVEWKRGQRVRIAKGAPTAKPPRGEDGEGKSVELGAEGKVIWIGRPFEPPRRGRAARMPEPLERHEIAEAGGGWRIGVELTTEPVGWSVWTTDYNLERVPAHAWHVLDAKQAEAALPERGAKVRARVVDPADGLVEVVIGRVCWAGVPKNGSGVARVGIERSTKATVWVDLLDDEGNVRVEVLGPPPPARCARAMRRR